MASGVEVGGLFVLVGVSVYERWLSLAESLVCRTSVKVGRIWAEDIMFNQVVLRTPMRLILFHGRYSRSCATNKMLVWSPAAWSSPLIYNRPVSTFGSIV